MTENAWSLAIVALVSFRNVGNTWKVCASLLLLAAVVANVVSALVIRLRSAVWFCAERPEHGAAVLHQADHGLVLDVEDLEDVGRVGRERRQVAEHVVEVLVVAADRLGELLLPDLERVPRGRIERVVDV